MEIRIKTIMQEKGIRMADFCRATETDPATIKTMISRGSCKIATLAKYAAALCVPVWEMIYDCGVSSVGRELDQWREPNYDNKINELMQSRNQKDVAQLMGINQSSLSLLLQRGNPGLPNIEKFAYAFGIEPWELFISREDMQKEIDRRNGILCPETDEENIQENSSNKEVYIEDIFATQNDGQRNNVTTTLTIEQSKEYTRRAIRMMIGSIGNVDEEKLEQLIEKAYVS